MLHRIGSMIGRDLKASSRETMTVWILFAPFLLALVVRAFVPAVGGTAVNLAVTEDVGTQMISALREYGKVEVFPDRQSLERRVMLLDDVAGITRDGETLRIVLEGNEREETRELPGLILADLYGPPQVEMIANDLGRAASPVRPYMAAFLAMAAALFGGIVMGFAIIEDKTAGTMGALGVTPLSGPEYVAGRAALGMVLALVLTFGALYTMGAAPFDPLQVLAMSASGSLLAVILGFLVGSVANNTIEAIGTFKFGFLPFWIVPVLGMVIPEAYRVTLYWMPTYWIFNGYRAIFLEHAAWAEVGKNAVIGFAVSLLFLAVSWRLLRRRLSLRG
jgi:ABC-2 type transport system permease protein